MIPHYFFDCMLLFFPDLFYEILVDPRVVWHFRMERQTDLVFVFDCDDIAVDSGKDVHVVAC